MVVFTMRRNMLTIMFVVGLLAIGLLQLVSSQNCRCARNLCCSQWGFCGRTREYCGPGCRSGPCWRLTGGAGDAGGRGAGGDGGGSVADIVGDNFFNGLISPNGSCPGRGFYTRTAFLEAIRSYPAFGTTGSNDDHMREIAAYFAHTSHETGRFCYIEEINGSSKNYCDSSNTQYPCTPGQGYFGRGPLQLSWNYNYGPAGQSIGFDGLNDPGIVSRNPVISFRTSLWFWMNNCHSRIISGQGFGSTILAINGNRECNGANPGTVTTRVNYYTQFCNQLGVPPGGNLTC